MQKVIVMYRLQPGVTLEDYKEWSLTTDQPLATAQPGILGFEPHAVDNAATPGMGIDVFEVVTVGSFADFQTMLTAEAMAPVSDSIGAFVDLGSISFLVGDPVVA